MFFFGNRSLQKFRDLHPSLVAVAFLGLQKSKHDFAVTEGLRTQARQRELFSAGRSMTLRSKHLLQDDHWAHAFDVMAVGDLNGDGDVDAQDGSITWDRGIYQDIANAMKEAAAELGISIRWGGDFKTFFDGPHFELA
jgi:peptidoglycan L-alanyl-D-glutamate endopeptidase CwlK